MTITLLMLAGGLVALFFGGDLLVRGAVGLAERLGVTPLVIGLVVVGFGTSMPELVTSVEAALAGSPDIAWGNIVGSNIANTLLILGAAAVIAPIALRDGAALRDAGVALGASLLLLLIAIAEFGQTGIGFALVALLFLYVGWCYRAERRHSRASRAGPATETADPAPGASGSGWLRPILLTIGGLALLVVGGRLLVTGAIDLARVAGLGETLIGLTIVALGTSLPELVTSLVAARRGQTDVAYGNVVGSNIYNLLGIGGVTMAVAPAPLPQALLPVDLGIMTLSAIAVFACARFAGGVSRRAGAVLLVAYAAFLAVLVLGAT